MATEGMARFEGFAQPGRSGVKTVLDAADKVAAPARAIDEIRALCDTVKDHAVIPSRRIRQILKRHGL